MWRIEFDSERFLPYLPEGCQANPGVYGFELADWLARALAARDLVTGYPLGEDWGWFIEYLDGELEFVIGCSSMCGENEGYTGASIGWSIFVDPRKSLKQKFLDVSAAAALEKITFKITQALKTEGIEFSIVET